MSEESETIEQCYVLDKHLKALQDAIVSTLAGVAMSKDVADHITSAVESITLAMAQNYLRIAINSAKEKMSERNS